MKNILQIDNLKTSFFTHSGEVKAVGGISFHVGLGETLGIVGESGSGKSVTSLSIMRLLAYPGRIINGSINFNGQNLLSLSEREMRRIRGNEISMIFQDPMTSLNPVFTIGNQLMEPIRLHQKLPFSKARNKALEMLSLVGIPQPQKRINHYPHEFSGGMRQRVMIAMALCCQPQLLIADEPTTALDVTIQAQILELLKDLRQKVKTSIILITHDLGVIAETCSRIIVMYAGMIVEEGSAEEIFQNARHPYTLGLLKSIPQPMAKERQRLVSIEGQPPDLMAVPTGCPFWPRCKNALLICQEQHPPVTALSPDHQLSCWLQHPNAPQGERGQYTYA